LGYNQWVPLSFEGDVPYFNSLHSWNFDVQTGAWSVADDNNYVRNGSFEADRKYIPSSVKPIQEQLKGWHSNVIQGNEIAVGVPKSPVLNYYNTAAARWNLHACSQGEMRIWLSEHGDVRRMQRRETSRANCGYPSELDFNRTQKHTRNGRQG